MNIKKITAFAAALALAFSLSACNSDSGTTAEADVSTTAKAETVKDETEAEETTVTEETTTEETTTTEEVTEPAVEFVEPAASNFEYQYDAVLKGVKITDYEGTDEAVRVPAEIDGDPVVCVKFVCNDSVKYVEIPDGVTEIEFNGCKKLENVKIPNSVTILCQKAFYKCENLKSIEIPNSVTEIGMR